MIIRLLLVSSLVMTVIAMGRETVLTAEGKQVNIIVWICPDPFLRQISFAAVSQSSDTTQIVYSIESKVQGYRSQMWSVTAVKFKRSTADLLPGRPSRLVTARWKQTTNCQNLCFISVDKQDTVVVIAAIAPLLK